eukprot:366095-Chlamydomonas_euryale.AAC.15
MHLHRVSRLSGRRAGGRWGGRSADHIGGPKFGVEARSRTPRGPGTLCFRSEGSRNSHQPKILATDGGHRIERETHSRQSEPPWRLCKACAARGAHPERAGLRPSAPSTQNRRGRGAAPVWCEAVTKKQASSSPPPLRTPRASAAAAAVSCFSTRSARILRRILDAS